MRCYKVLLLNFKETTCEEAYRKIHDFKVTEHYIYMELPPDGSITIIIDHARQEKYFKISGFTDNEERFRFVRLANNWKTLETMDEDIFNDVKVFRNLEEYADSIGDGGYTINSIFEAGQLTLRCFDLMQEESSRLVLQLARRALFFEKRVILTEKNDSLLLELALLQIILKKIKEPVTCTGIKDYIKRFGGSGLNVAMFNIAKCNLNIACVDFEITSSINNVEGLRHYFEVDGKVTLIMPEEELQNELMSLQEELIGRPIKV